MYRDKGRNNYSDSLDALVNGSESPLDVFDSVDPSDIDLLDLHAPVSRSREPHRNHRSVPVNSIRAAKDPFVLEAKLGPAFFRDKVKDPDKLNEIDQYRVDYQRFRLGEPHGTKMEPQDVMADLEDDDDIDDEDDEEEGGEEGKEKSAKKRKRTREENKALHKAVERKRTRKINELITRLKSEMENQSIFVKKDKASILAATLTYVQDLQQEVRNLKRERESLILQLNNPSSSHLSFRPSPSPPVNTETTKKTRSDGGSDRGSSTHSHTGNKASSNHSSPEFVFSSTAPASHPMNPLMNVSVKVEPTPYNPGEVYSGKPSSNSIDYSLLLSPSFVNSPEHNNDFDGGIPRGESENIDAFMIEHFS